MEGSYVFEALWSVRNALCLKVASLALPGERSGVLKLMPLRRYLMKFFPCIGIWILLFQPCLRNYYEAVVVVAVVMIDHGLISCALCFCFVQFSG